MELARAVCPVCEKTRPVQRSGTNHILHLLVSVFTVAAWVPGWILVSMDQTGWRCQKCGADTDTHGQKLGRAILYGAAFLVTIPSLYVAWLAFSFLR